MPGKDKTFLAFSCTHCPLQDEEAVSWMLDRIAVMRPDYVLHLGDGHEADAASRFPSEFDHDLPMEFKAHNDLLKRVRLAHEPATRIFIEGNHDANLMAWNRVNRKLRGLCNYRDHEPELQHWVMGPDYEYSPRGVVRLGQITFGHGFATHGRGDETMSLELGIPYGLWIGGHTHRPLPPTQAMKTIKTPLPYWYANAGCMRDLKPHFVKRSSTIAWGQAVVVGTFRELEHEKMIPMERQWEAETIIFRMGHD